MKQKTWDLTLTCDELVALARAMSTQIQLLATEEDSDEKATTWTNLCRVIAKMPEEEWFEVQS